MSFSDFSIVILYLVIIWLLALKFRKRARSSITEYFLAGRTLAWWVGGLSVAATLIGADTPMWIGGLTRNGGIQGNWFWWVNGIGKMGSAFLFAHLWYRTQATTDIEFIALRYGQGGTAKALRLFEAVYGILQRCVGMGIGLRSVAKMIVVFFPATAIFYSLPLAGDVQVALLYAWAFALLVLVYNNMSGLYGVAHSDVLQFALTVISSYLLAVIFANAFSQEGGYLAVLHSSEVGADRLRFIPDLTRGDDQALGFILLVTVGWWGNLQGSKFKVQRMLATKSEHDAMLANFLSILVAHAIRPWPWIVVALLSLKIFPEVADAEQSYILVLQKYLPLGLRGLMVAGFVAAFMSTFDTYLNLGASYAINDIGRPLRKKAIAPHSEVRLSRLVSSALMLIAMLMSLRIQGIQKTLQYTWSLRSGHVVLVLARWYWWRITAQTEILTLVVSLVVSNLLFWLLPDTTGQHRYALRFVLNTGFTTAVWVLFTLIRNPPTGEHLATFYQKIRVAGPGWRPIREQTGVEPANDRMPLRLFAWLAGVVLLYGIIFGAGYAILQQWLKFGITLTFIALSAVGVKRAMSKLRRHPG